MANEFLPSTDKPTSKRAGWNPKFDMLLAAVFLLGAEAIYSVCLLQGGPFDGFEPAYVLAMKSLRFSWALLTAVAIGLLLSKGLSDAGGWRKASVAVLIAPYAITAIGCATNNPDLLNVVPSSSLETILWPALSALLAHVLQKGEHPLGIGKGTALYFAFSLILIVVTTYIERYQHDYVRFFFMAVVCIAAWCSAVGGANKLGGRGWAVLVLVAAGIVAAWLAIIMNWRFWDILGEPGYAGIWVSDRLESVQRFLSFQIEGWDALPARNALFLIASVGGPIVSAFYVLSSIASFVFTGLACSKLAHRMKARSSAPGALVVSAYGVACGACIVLGLASNLLNISTCVGAVQWLGAIPASFMIIAALLGRRAFGNSENLPDNDAVNVELSGCGVQIRTSTAEGGSSEQGDVEGSHAIPSHRSFPSTIQIKEA